ncbi:unnamed protein product [Gordionus sp. m RMFG-2023]|uniref:serine/arginine repetitive matrix protein 1-like isoform X2 n=1 Tax=Gordionus sp. m RMFG-2023 TaxID=3053472 RepID=UPI0030E36C59
MTDAGFYRGTNAEQDSRFSDKNKKLMKQMKFSENLEQKIDMTKVNLDVLKPWITKRLCELLNFEDDVIIEFVFNQLMEKKVDPKIMQINLTGFLNAKNARIFMGDLWSLLISAQNNIGGIPEAFLQQKKAELMQKYEEDAKATAERDLSLKMNPDQVSNNWTGQDSSKRKELEQLDGKHQHYGGHHGQQQHHRNLHEKRSKKRDSSSSSSSSGSSRRTTSSSASTSSSSRHRNRPHKRRHHHHHKHHHSKHDKQHNKSDQIKQRQSPSSKYEVEIDKPKGKKKDNINDINETVNEKALRIKALQSLSKYKDQDKNKNEGVIKDTLSSSNDSSQSTSNEEDP